MRRLKAVVVGSVQGVGFRAFVRREASWRGITGYVRNGDDGDSVEVVAEGDESALAALVDALRSGPRFARVDRVETTFSEASNGFRRFSVEM
ncbi:MAG: acylphosphatase [Chloroflexota bacterium]